jgi:putative ABC transport system permease protein
VSEPAATTTRARRSALRPASVLAEAFASLVAHPLRSGLTALSVAFGAAVLLILLSYSTGVPETTAAVLRSLGSKELVVEPRRSHGPGGGGNRSGREVRIRYADLSAIRDACPSIAEIAPSFNPGRGGPVFAADKSWPWARLSGVGAEYAEVTGLALVAGRWFTKQEELAAEDLCVVSLPLVEGLFEGRTPLGETIDARGRRFEIIGVYESKAAFAYSLLVPYPTAMAMGDSDGRYVSEVAFAPVRPDLAREAIAEIRAALGALYSFDPDDPTAIDVKENAGFVEKVEATSVALEGLVLTIAALALILGCLGAANVVGIAVAERTAELGLRKALGATAARIRAEVLAETLGLCVAGGALGVLVGSSLVAALGPLRLAERTLLVPHADRSLLALALAVLVVTAVVAGWPASGRAARLDPVEALREE